MNVSKVKYIYTYNIIYNFIIKIIIYKLLSFLPHIYIYNVRHLYYIIINKLNSKYILYILLYIKREQNNKKKDNINNK